MDDTDYPGHRRLRERSLQSPSQVTARNPPESSRYSTQAARAGRVHQEIRGEEHSPQDCQVVTHGEGNRCDTNWDDARRFRVEVARRYSIRRQKTSKERSLTVKEWNC